ncbi:MAG TPA: murein biosynthesis integral membrane protein MurJ [Microthrixaceae bacterium]|nr:murein biosynthesis integral membrane protein MurJ [Microthrixaceae bacterium]
MAPREAGTAPPARSLLAASTAPALGTALSRVTGLVRVAALTAALGLTSVADVYNLANTAPNIVYELVIGGVLSSTLVPLFISAREDSKGVSEDDASSVMVTVAFVAITVLTVLAVLGAPLLNRLFALPLEGEERRRQLDHGGDFLMLLLPQIFFYGMMTLGTALLHARRRFAAPAFAPVLTNVVISAAALVVYFMFEGDGPNPMRTVYVLGLGTTAGIAAMAIALLPALRRAEVRLRWDFRPKHPAVRAVLRLSGWTVGFTIANSVTTLVVLTMARGAGVGAVSAYQYAFIFFQLPYGLIAVSIMTAILPELSHAANAGDEETFGAHFREGLSLLLTLMIPAAVAYLVLGEPLISLLLQRGQFNPDSAARTADMLAGFSIGLPAFAVFLYCVRAFHSRKDTRTPFYLNLGENLLNIALVVPAIGLFGTPGLSVAYSVAYVVAAVAALVVLARRVPGLLGRRDVRTFVPGLLVAAAVGVWVAVANTYLPEGTNDFVRILACLVVAALVFAGSVVAARPHGFEAITRRARAALPGRR